MASEARNHVRNTENTCYAPPAFLMESPRDPVSYMQQEALEQDMASYWNFREANDLAQLMKASFVTLDQGPIGHIKRKPTTLTVANLPDTLELQGWHWSGSCGFTSRTTHPIKRMVGVGPRAGSCYSREFEEICAATGCSRRWSTRSRSSSMPLGHGRMEGSCEEPASAFSQGLPPMHGDDGLRRSTSTNYGGQGSSLLIV